MSECPRKPTTWAARLSIGFLSLLLLSASYYGVYRLALHPSYVVQIRSRLYPRFRFIDYGSRADSWMHFLFAPAHAIDRRLRSEHWNSATDDEEYEATARELRQYRHAGRTDEY